MLKVSIITVAFNAASTIEETIRSVASQDHPAIEHILIDGDSSDDTMEIVGRYQSHFAKIVSEPDNGIYDAMNKGIRLASGDVVGMLNADDVYQDETVLTQVAETLADDSLDACYADLVYVKTDDLSNVVRNWRSRDHTPGLSFRGWMPAHPTLFLKRQMYDRVGLFDTSLRYQADLEFCARLFEVYRVNSRYVPRLWVRMRLGGVTNNSLKTIMLGNWESYLALRRLGLRRNVFNYFAIKFASRIRQFF